MVSDVGVGLIVVGDHNLTMTVLELNDGATNKMPCDHASIECIGVSISDGNFGYASEGDRGVAGMSEQIRLIHPIYLDVPMLVSFAAAIEGGLSFGAEVTREASTSNAKAAEGNVKFGLSGLFGRFLEASADLTVAGAHEDEERSVVKSSRSHTEASVAILLYDRLRRDRGYIVDPETLDDAKGVEPGALVEIAGTVEKNAIDAMIDYIDAADILSNMGTSEQKTPTGSISGKRRGSGVGKDKQENQSPLGHMRALLDQDRKRTPISNLITTQTKRNLSSRSGIGGVLSAT